MTQNPDEFFQSVISDPDQPVVLFALEWCEFCWSVSKLFRQLDLSFRTINLDSAEYQENDFGSKVRAILSTHTGAPTIPQIFIGGKYLGGATDTFDAYKQGVLQSELIQAGIDFKDVQGLDPYHLHSSGRHPI